MHLLIYLFIFLVSSRMVLLTLLRCWGVFNLFAGWWEIYVFGKRNQLYLEDKTLWQKMYEGKINIYNFWIEAWKEYCKVDSRYIYRPYVWFFELLNAFIAVLYIFFLALGTYSIIKILLGISILNCLCYFVTLAVDRIIFTNDREKQYTQLWMYPCYYAICSIWLIVPWILYKRI